MVMKMGERILYSADVALSDILMDDLQIKLMKSFVHFS